MGNINTVITTTVLGLANGVVPLNQPTSILVTSDCYGGLKRSDSWSYNITCSGAVGNQGPYTGYNLTDSFTFLTPFNASTGEDSCATLSHTFVYPAQSVPTFVSCAFSTEKVGTTLNTALRLPGDEQIVFQAGPDLGGAPFSLVVGRGQFVELSNNIVQTTGWTMEAWYRCIISNPPTIATESFLVPAFPEGVFVSRGGVGTNQTLIDFEFSHTSTQLCGTATRQLPGDEQYDQFRACSVVYNSTMGLWVHGAMTFDAPTGAMQFYLNGALLPLGFQSWPNATVVPSATTPLSPSYRPRMLMARTRDDNNNNFNYFLAEGTGLDNIRMYGSAASPAQITSRWNRALNLTAGAEPGLLQYAAFHRKLSHLLTQGYPGSLSVQSNVGTDPQYVHQTSVSPFRSCDKNGCNEPNTPVTVPVSSSSSTGAAAASTASMAGSSSAGSSGNNGAASSTAGPNTGAASVSAQVSSWSMLLVAALALSKLVQ